MLYIVLTTGRCNLSCRYCGGSFPPALVPWEVQYELEDLRRLVEQDPNAIIAFYGGEPLLNPQFIRAVMDNVRAERFVIQTNGLLVRSLDPEYWRRFDAVLLSIDGPRDVTDFYRGRGVYDSVLSAADWLRRVGFSGDLIARMALSERGDVYRDVTHLVNLGLFDHVHWQLDVVWSDGWEDFDGWAERYKEGLSRLVDLWLEEARRGRILGVVPILGVLKVRLFGGGFRLPCGAGRDAFAISTDGRILACPIAVQESWAVVGRVGSVRDPEELRGSILIGEPCTSCPYYRYCGGRCLYAYRERLWGEEGFRKVCYLTRHLIDEVLRIAPEVEGLLRTGVISRREVDYPEFNNTTEIIP